MMMLHKLLSKWEDRVKESETQIVDEIQPEIARLQYEVKISQRLMSKADNAEDIDHWRIHIDVLEMLISQQEEQLAELKTDIHHYNALITEAKRDLDHAGTTIADA